MSQIPSSLSNQTDTNNYTVQREHWDHVNSLIERAERRIRAKYVKGVLEHGGKIWEKSQMWLLDQAIDEAIDQIVYLLTLRDQLDARNKP